MPADRQTQRVSCWWLLLLWFPVSKGLLTSMRFPSMVSLTSAGAALEDIIAVGIEALGALQAAVVAAVHICTWSRFCTFKCQRLALDSQARINAPQVAAGQRRSLRTSNPPRLPHTHCSWGRSTCCTRSPPASCRAWLRGSTRRCRPPAGTALQQWENGTTESSFRPEQGSESGGTAPNAVARRCSHILVRLPHVGGNTCRRLYRRLGRSQRPSSGSSTLSCRPRRRRLRWMHRRAASAMEDAQESRRQRSQNASQSSRQEQVDQCSGCTPSPSGQHFLLTASYRSASSKGGGAASGCTQPDCSATWSTCVSTRRNYPARQARQAVPATLRHSPSGQQSGSPPSV